MYISKNDTIKPSSKLPLSPKNILGNLNIEKLKHKKIPIEIPGIVKIN